MQQLMVRAMFAVDSHVSLDQQHRFKGGVGADLLHELILKFSRKEAWIQS